MAERPTGAVTFIFTDIEGSTAAWEDDPKRMAADLEIHDRVLREAIESRGGFVFATGGDSFSAAFSSPTMALSAAVEAQRGYEANGQCSTDLERGYFDNFRYWQPGTANAAFPQATAQYEANCSNTSWHALGGDFVRDERETTRIISHGDPVW